MGRNMILALGLRGFGAIAWFGYFWVLSRILPPAALGHTLYALALANVGAMLASAGWTQLVIREGARAKARNQMGHFAGLIHSAIKGALWRASLAPVAAVVITTIGTLPPTLPDLPFVILTCAITATLALLQIKAAAQRANSRLTRALTGQGILPAAFPLGLSIIAALFLPVSALMVLCLHLLSLLFILFYLGRDLPKITHKTPATHSLRALSLGQAGQVLLGHLDILVLGWVISPAEAGIYLIVRRLAGLVSLAFDALRSATAPPLAVAFRGENPRDLATRVNRIFLLTGVTCGIVLWLIAPFILPLFGAANALAAFYGLLIGTLTPALFGATGVLMVMGDLETTRAKLVLALLPAGLIILIVGSHFGITGLAFGAGFIQLLLGAGGAFFLLRRHGIRPGLFPPVRWPTR